MDTNLSIIMSKPNPSYKSKRYRDKLRHEIRDLEGILPIDRTVLHRKLDSQTVFRMSIAFFRSKLFLQDIIRTSPYLNVPLSVPPFQVLSPTATQLMGTATNFDFDQECLLQALDGFLLILTTDGTIMYVSNNILHHLGFNQIDLVMRCIYGIVHPDDQQELKTILEDTLMSDVLNHTNQDCCTSPRGHRICRQVSFLCRMKCFSGATTGYLKMHCAGHLRHFPSVLKSQRTTNQLLFAFCRPFVSVTTESATDVRKSGFWTKHDLDLKFKQMDPGLPDSLGYEVKYLEGKSFYQFVHPEDLYVFKSCHRTLISTEEIHTIYFRIQHKDGTWIWVHTRGKVVFKNSKKYSIVFTHCPVREEDSTYIQQEVVLRHKNAIQDLMFPPVNPTSTYRMEKMNQNKYPYYQEASLPCPSSWHTTSDRHSPVFPNNLHGQALYYKKDAPQGSLVQSDGNVLHAGYITQDSNMCTVDRNNAYKQSNTDIYKQDNAYRPQGNIYNQDSGYDQIVTNTQIYQQNQQVYRQYHLQFNGIGISPRHHQQYVDDSNQVNQTTDFSAMFIQGQLTAVEANAACLNNVSSCNNNNIPTCNGAIPMTNNASSYTFDTNNLFSSSNNDILQPETSSSYFDGSYFDSNSNQDTSYLGYTNQNAVKAELPNMKCCYQTEPQSSCRFPSRQRSRYMGEDGSCKMETPFSIETVSYGHKNKRHCTATDVQHQSFMKNDTL